jgi:uncharacterized protein (TIGR03067 family)
LEFLLSKHEENAMLRFCTVWIAFTSFYLLAAPGLRAVLDDIDVDKLPKTVTDAVKAKFPGAELTEASKETEKDKAIYQVSFTYKKHDYNIECSADGAFRAINREIEEEELPKSVAKALKEKFPDATYDGIEEAIQNDKVEFYSVALTYKDQEFEVECAADGAFRSISKEIEAEDLPEKVSKALEAKYPKATYDSIGEVSKDDKVAYYTVELTTSADKEVELMIDPSGKFVEEEKIDGTWAATEVAYGGQFVPKEVSGQMRFVFADGNLTISVAGKIDGTGTYRIDPGKQPKSFDVVPGEGDDKGKTLEGIYELNGDTLKICYNGVGKGRAAKFTSTAEAKSLLVSLKLEKK